MFRLYLIPKTNHKKKTKTIEYNKIKNNSIFLKLFHFYFIKLYQLRVIYKNNLLIYNIFLFIFVFLSFAFFRKTKHILHA